MEPKHLPDMPAYSVLMSVYAGEKPEYLRESLESMYSQTYPAADFVLVCDGKLTEKLDETVKEYENKYPDTFHTVRLEKKRGSRRMCQYRHRRLQERVYSENGFGRYSFASRGATNSFL